MEVIILDRTLITGAVTSQMPYIVVEEIAAAHSITVPSSDVYADTKLHDYINKLPKVKVDLNNVRGDEWGLLARYVDPKQKFRKNELIEAARYLNSYTTSYEHPTTEARLNNCILYRLLQHRHIDLPINVTEKEMLETLRLSAFPIEALRSNLIIMASNISAYHVIKTIKGLERVVMIKHTPVGASLENSATALKDRISKITAPIPLNHHEAILIAAEYHCINLRLAADPMREFMLLSLVGRDMYLNQCLSQSADAGIRRVHDNDPDLMDLELSFDPYLPATAYRIGQMRELHIKMGEADTSIMSIYMKLQHSSLLSSFYHGKQLVKSNSGVSHGIAGDGGTLETVETLASGDIAGVAADDDLTNDKIVSYGVRFQHFRPSTYEELANHFEQAEDYINPFVKVVRGQLPEVLSQASIRKLKLLCSISRPGERSEAIASRTRLLASMVQIEVKHEKSDAKAREFLMYYKKSGVEQQTDMAVLLREILALSMYMRGWKGGNDPLPIKMALSPEDEEHNISVRVTDSVAKIENKCFSMGDVATHVLSLPLVRYRDGRYVPTVERSKGLTIGQRIQIVKAGYKVDTNSCIRTSSNYLAASVYRYMSLVGLNPGFQIAALRYIN